MIDGDEIVELSNYLKHEVSKGFVQALLKQAGYRVIPSGMEHLVREVTPLSEAQYRTLDLPPVLRALPDYVILDADVSGSHMVDVNYRARVDANLISKLRAKAEILGGLTLVLFNGRTTASVGARDLSGVARCCRIERTAPDTVVAYLKKPKSGTLAVPLDCSQAGKLWSGMLPLKAVFDRLDYVEPKLEKAVEIAARALAA